VIAERNGREPLPRGVRVCRLPIPATHTAYEDIEVKSSIIALTVAAALGAAACNKNNEKSTADTSTMRAADTSNGEVRPTTDTLVKTTTTTMDTIKGKVADTTAGTSMKKPTKKPATKKKGY
jgi:hypothetical protein